MKQTAGITAYEYVLVATERFLRIVGEEYWAKWLADDIIAWRENGDVTHHRSAYGGMGSFNDVIICPVNGHKVTAEQEPWADAIFGWLKAILFYLSKNPTEAPAADEWPKLVGLYSPSLVAFVGGDRAPDSMKGFVGSSLKAAGARCLTCGYAEITPREIDTAIAEQWIPGVVFNGCATRHLEKIIDDVLSMSCPELSEHRKFLREAAAASGIQLTEREGPMRPCPKCGADDSAIYRWNLNDENPPKYVPTSDNLSLRRLRKSAPRWTAWARIISLFKQISKRNGDDPRRLDSTE